MRVADADHRGSGAWLAARDAARAAGRDLSPLVDMDPFDREIRLGELSRSDVPDERALAFYQEGAALIAAEAAALETIVEELNTGTALDATIDVLLTPPAPLPLLPLLPMPDMAWNGLFIRSRIVMHARRNGHVLVVHESGARPGRYYPVVDGHHLSWRGDQETYGNLLDAITAADAAAEPEHPNG